MTKNIILAGDSWTKVWVDAQDICIHSSLTKFNESLSFQEIFLQGLGHNVVDAGRPGADNTTGAQGLEALQRRVHKNFLKEHADYIIYYFTDTYRTPCCLEERNQLIINAAREGKQQFLDALHQERIIDLERLANIVLANFDHAHVLIVGGHSKVDRADVEYLNRLHNTDRFHCVFENALEWLFIKSGNLPSQMPHDFYNLHETFNSILDHDLHPDVIDYLYEQATFKAEYLVGNVYNPWIFPDSGFHANANGQLLIINALLHKIDEIENN